MVGQVAVVALDMAAAQQAPIAVTFAGEAGQQIGSQPVAGEEHDHEAEQD